MLHLIYILAFTILAFLAVGNLIRNLISLGVESQRSYGSPNRDGTTTNQPFAISRSRVSHPELLDDAGNMVNEPYLVMRSIDVDDAREQLDAIYNASPSSSDEAHGEA